MVTVARSRDKDEIRSWETLLYFEKIEYQVEDNSSSPEGYIEILAAEQDRQHIEEILVEYEREKDTGNADRPSMRYPLRSVIYSILWFFGLGSIFGIYYGIKGYRQNRIVCMVGILFGVFGIVGAFMLLFPNLIPFTSSSTVYVSEPIKQTSVSKWWYIVGGFIVVFIYVWLFTTKKHFYGGEDGDQGE